MSEFKEQLAGRFRELIEAKPEKYQKVKVWTQDEARIGLMPIHRRRITEPGVRPTISSEMRREYIYLFGLIEPLTGDNFMLELPTLETVTMQVFLDHFSRRDPDSWHIILMDNATAHTTGKLVVPENVVILYLPACAPELNPIERFWKELKDWLSDYEVATMKKMSELISEGLKSFTSKALSSITSFEYLMKAWETANA